MDFIQCINRNHGNSHVTMVTHKGEECRLIEECFGSLTLGVVHILRNQFLEHFYPPSVISFTHSYCVKITLA